MLPESLTLGQRNLEDVFLKLTGRELRRRDDVHPGAGCGAVPPPGSGPGRHGGAADAAQRRAAAAGRGDPRDRAGRRRQGAHRIGIDFEHPAVDVFTPGVLALAIMSTAFTSLAIATGFERRYGVIKRLGSSPLPRSGLLAGKVGGLLVVEALQVVVISLVALALGWDPRRRTCSGPLLAMRARHRGVRLARAVRGRRAARRGHPGGRQPGLPAAAGRRRRRAPGIGVRRLRRRRRPGCPPGRSARRCATRSSTAHQSPGDLAVLLAWAVVGTVLTARTFTWE